MFSTLGGQTLQQGRKGLQLAARQAEVLDFLRAAGVQEGCYSGAAVPEPCFVEHLGGGPEELNPYRSLDSNRMALSGRGSWDIARHLEPALLLPFLDPLTLRTFEPQPSPGPTFQREDRRQVLGLLKKWDDLGLLSLVEGPRDDSELTRICGAFKDPSRDRQIGDRRNVNNKEARIADGPSRRLPAGSVLCKLSCPRWTHALFGSCVDRKDFYHQALVSAPRAASNAIEPVFELRAFLGCQAHAAYLAHADHSFCAQCPSGVFKPSSVLVDAEVKVHGAFRSLLQGDHAGVEFAASGHEGLLRSFGVLGDPPQGRLLNRCPVASSVSTWTGLIIDDLFSISCEPAVAHPDASLAQPGPSAGHVPASASEVLLRRAKEAYARERLPGSDEKDQFSRRVFTVAGAQVDASPESVAEGGVYVGLPASRRLALSFASLQVASLPLPYAGAG